MSHPTRRAALAAVACTLLVPRVVVAQQKLTTITMAGLPEDSATPVLFGISSGAFRKAGLEVTMQVQRSGPSVASGIAGGAYQIGKVSLNPLIDAHSKGIPFVIVAPGGMSTKDNPIAGLMVKTDSPIKKASDLNGKTIAVGALNDIFTLAMRTWMEKNGGNPSTLKLVEIPISAIGAAIEAGRVDGGSANEPVLSSALESGKLHVIARTFDAISPKFMFTAYVALRAWADANREAVKQFQRVVHESALYSNTHHSATVDDIAKFTGLDPEKVKKMARTQGAVTTEPALIQPVIDAAAYFHDIPAKFPAKDLIWT